MACVIANAWDGERPLATEAQRLSVRPTFALSVCCAHSHGKLRKNRSCQVLIGRLAVRTVTDNAHDSSRSCWAAQRANGSRTNSCPSGPADLPSDTVGAGPFDAASSGCAIDRFRNSTPPAALCCSMRVASAHQEPICFSALADAGLNPFKSVPARI